MPSASQPRENQDHAVQSRDSNARPRPDSSGQGQPPSEFGTRLRTYREESGLSLSALAERTKLSKGYLSSLENNHEPRRPSAEVLYALAQTLGVTMSDLMGRQLLPAASPEVPASLADFAEQEGLNQADISMLASIQFRGEQPRTSERWRYIYQSIRNSIQMDNNPSS
ncbi:helix-turn-helix domain-containing protein [Nocardioides marmoriginsengisoli]|uniref:helix-turn-helix domain-containing protein n=1 Tax=Nocardioides marmoriginsengisoli TaxID=661483 RepID=UPI0016214611